MGFQSQKAGDFLRFTKQCLNVKLKEFAVAASPPVNYTHFLATRDSCSASENTINTANHTLVKWQLNMLPVEIRPRLITL